MKRAPWWYIATWFGCGHSPLVSGTVGSFAALPFAFLIQWQLGSIALFVAAMAMFFIGWWASREYIKANPGNLDPKQIVVDEVAGQWLILVVLPMTWQGYLAGFILFRAFDIVKPWPVSWADRRIKGALGVMLDDILAALYPILLYIALMFYEPYLAQKLAIMLGVDHV